MMQLIRGRPGDDLVILEAEASLVRLRQNLQLSGDEQEAIDGDVMTFQKLRAKHWDTATPAGPSPQELDALRLIFRFGRFNFHGLREQGAASSTPE
jgi:hypothetical protein